MKAHFLQHVPFEGLGSMEPWLLKKGFQVSCTRLYDGEKLPPEKDVEFLIVMGGPMSVNDTEDHPWLEDEKSFIRSVVLANKPVLGVCLGAQLMAAALGGKVYPNEVKEIGWFSVSGVEGGVERSFQIPQDVTVFQWHGETFDLPQGAIHLARSRVCENQAFQFGEKAIALQFHLETTPASAQALVENCRDELLEGPHIQSEEIILSSSQESFQTIHELMEKVLGFLTEK